MSSKKVAVVTGANKGIGFAIVRGLCKQFSGDVFLTARDEERGAKAVADLEKEGLKPKFHQLDITDEESRERLAICIAENYGGLDILVNNAGMAYKVASTAPFDEQAEMSMKTNYFATLAMCNRFMPLFRTGARVVNVSSMATQYALGKCSPQVVTKLKALSTTEALSDQLNKFVSVTKTGSHKEAGWADSAYGMSKVGVTLMTPILQRQLEADEIRKDIIMNACCPGYVSTDMSSFKGNKTIDEGADTPLYLALLPSNADTRGKFVSDRQVKYF